AGGRVVKNVTGYDLCKLLAGSFGTLAVMGHVTFKVLPAPERTTTLALLSDDLDDLAARLRRAAGTAYEVSGAALLPPAALAGCGVPALQGAGSAAALMRIEGVGPSVHDRMTSLIREIAADVPHVVVGEESLALWRAIRDLAVLPPRRVLWRLSVAPTAGLPVARRLMELGADLFLDQVGGQVWATMDETWTDRVRALVADGGHATLVRAPDEARRDIAVFQPQPPALAALAKRVKQAFDPENILEPGRMAPVA
ncbi:MAG TPA: glycolate oxidase subunit GlcE, partial [Geminicoccus sp.]|nr:glycolate oxidase subunit GlcE [Geminicoccus sp.]